MKVKHLLSVALATCSLLTSCLSEPDFTPVVEDGIPINLDGSISQVSTKVNAQGFEDNDALGLYAVNYENSNQTPGILLDKGNQADHVKYIFDESTWKWTPVRPVYYKDVNTNVDLYVFYPHAEPASVSAYNFEVQKDQSQAEKSGRLSGYEASDFMWTKVEGVTPTESAVKVILQHKMAGVHVILQEGSGFEVAGDWDLLDKKVLVTNTTRKAVIDLSTGEVSPLGDAQATGIVMAPQTDGSFRAIVVPQTVQAGTPVLNITVGGVSYNFTKDASVTYTSGKLSQFTITVNRKTAAGDYEFVLTDTQIVDWKEDINTHEGEARQYYCVHVEEPGTLGDLIKADGKNPDKIKNLKVSGTIHAGDFYFMRDSMIALQAVNLKEITIKRTYVVFAYVNDISTPVIFDEKPENVYAAVKEIYPSCNSFTGVSGICEYNEIPMYSFLGKSHLAYISLPEYLTRIGDRAFDDCTMLSGHLIIPDSVTYIGEQAFDNCTNLTSLSLPAVVDTISDYAFRYCSSMSGSLTLPKSLKYIGREAFYFCKNFTGTLNLPSELNYLGVSAFASCSGFTGDLLIPETLKIIESSVFSGCSGLTGQLFLHDNLEFATYGDQFSNCGFTGELVLPQNIESIPKRCFCDCNFSSLATIPDALLEIGEEAFRDCSRLQSSLTFPDGFLSIGQRAFRNCGLIEGIVIPRSLGLIKSNAFENCYAINSIVCNSSEPPSIDASVFAGVPKDNFTVEVPANAVNRYATDPVWGQFRRISAYYDFSISRNRARALNAETSKTYILRAPADHDWSIESKPDWITVTPSSGTGKTEVTVTFSEMAPADAASISVEMTDPTYAYETTTKNLNGRAGEIVFLLDDKDYRTTMAVEQFDYQYGDGDVITLQEATEGDGVDIVFMGDCYDAADIAAGNYLADLQEAMGYYFDIEPYTTYKDYFNVYAVLGVSDDSGMGTLNTIKDAKFGSTFGEDRLVQPDMNMCFEYACKAPINDNISQTLIVLVENTTEYDGVCYMYGDGSAVACCPKSADAYPYDFRGIVQHEAGGHGFGKLADEYIYHNAFISTCTCLDGCGHTDDLNRGKANGWYRNLELTGDVNEVGWSHFIFHPKYSNVVDIYEGGYFHSRGVYRSEPTSCMNNNIPYYSAISRQAMVERIMEYAGETFDLETFIEKDVTTASPTTKSGEFDLNIPIYDNGKQHAPVYMGDKPDFLK